MDRELLPEPAADGLRRARLTYAEVGQSLDAAPRGYQGLRRSLVVGAGADRFEEASGRLLSWEMHRRAGIGVRPSSPCVEEGAVAVLRIGWPVLGLDAPVRVVRVLDEDGRRGFAYGTLPGHPESGEESFVVELLADGDVRFTVAAFSRPASRLARLGGPVSAAVQRWVTSRYLHAV